MRIEQTSTPVVILQAIRHGGLGLARSLGRAGVPVYVVDSDPLTPAFRSRYVKGKFPWDFNDSSEADSLAFLLRIGRSIGRRSILVPTTDRASTFVAENTAALMECYTFPLQRPELVRSLASKREMFFLAQAHRIPTAKSVFPTCREDVLGYLEKASFPMMLKGIDGERLGRRAGNRMFITRDARELLALYDAAEDPAAPNIMIQEYIPGGDDTVWMFNGYFDANSDCLLGVTGKKIHQFPAYTGMTSLGVCLRNDEVDGLTRRFMKAVGYRGILDIGYRYDARDGQYKVLDVNPRIGATFRLFASDSGMDVARALYLDMTGQPVRSGNPIQGRKWMIEDFDLVSSLRYLRDRKVTLGKLLSSYGGVQETAFFAWDDLAPLLPLCAGDVRDGFRRGWRTARRGTGSTNAGVGSHGIVGSHNG